MKEGYKVLRTIGQGCFIEVYNFIGLNTVAQYRFTIPIIKHSKELVGIWKQKTI
jgi:hypothetical protein